MADTPPLLRASEDDEPAVTSLEAVGELVEVAPEGVVNCEVILIRGQFE
jgi:hypothetical protein